MRITDNPCRYCEKRTAECRLTCVRYKVYQTAKQKEYKERRKRVEEHEAIVNHFCRRKERIENRSIRFTPTKTSEMKER